MSNRRPNKITRSAKVTKRKKLPSDLESDNRVVNLTAREREVLAVWREVRFIDKQVARRLGTKARTVQNQLASISHKLGAQSRSDLAAMAVTLNLRCTS
jgi:DNA-binding CsgD family transcriptional regulator